MNVNRICESSVLAIAMCLAFTSIVSAQGFYSQTPTPARATLTPWTGKQPSGEAVMNEGKLFGINTVAQEFAHAMRTNPDLRGAWLHVEFLPNSEEGLAAGMFKIRRVLDASRVEVQKRELHKLINTWIPAANQLVAEELDQYYPFSELMTNLQDWVEANPNLSGCLVEDAYYVADKSDETRLSLMLRGRVGTEPQNEALEVTCVQLMRRSPGWVRPHAPVMKAASFPLGDDGEDLNSVVLDINPRTVDVEVIPPAYGAGITIFEIGMQQFYRGQFRDAARSFQKAVIEGPSTLEFRYWRILAELAQGNRDRAYFIMQCAVNRPGFQQQLQESHRSISHSLRRVQGPVRYALHDLQAKAVFERSGKH